MFHLQPTFHLLRNEDLQEQQVWKARALKNPKNWSTFLVVVVFLERSGSVLTARSKRASESFCTLSHWVAAYTNNEHLDDDSPADAKNGI
jgi:hypothetical protein